MTETENREGEHKSSQQPESSAIESNNTKPKHAGGRHPKGWYEADVQEVLNGGARLAARILRAHLEQTKGHKTIKDSVLKICFYVIDHAIGKARQKIEHSGGVLTYRALADGAAELDKKPRPVLADVMEIANKYDQEHPEPKADDKNEKP